MLRSPCRNIICVNTNLSRAADLFGAPWTCRITSNRENAMYMSASIFLSDDFPPILVLQFEFIAHIYSEINFKFKKSFRPH